MGVLRGYLLTSIRRRNHFTLCSLLMPPLSSILANKRLSRSSLYYTPHKVLSDTRTEKTPVSRTLSDPIDINRFGSEVENINMASRIELLDSYDGDEDQLARLGKKQVLKVCYHHSRLRQLLFSDSGSEILEHGRLLALAALL